MEFFELQAEIESRHLDLDKILKLPSSYDKEIILELFKELMDSFYGEKGMNFPGGIRVDFIRATVVYNTLVEGGYLVTKREANLEKVLG